MDWLNNPWIIGIGGGILSGLIVTAVSRFVLSRRENREYLQKVSSANRELIYSLRPGISEGVVPVRSVVDSLTTATARKYGVERKDVYGPGEIVQELLKEVMDSSFISAKTKEEYCTKLCTLAEAPVPSPRMPAELFEVGARFEQPRTEAIAEYRRRTTWMMSVMVGTLAALMTGLFALLTQFKDTIAIAPKELPDALDQLRKLVPVLLPTLLSLVAVIASVWFFVVEREISHRRRDSHSSESSRKEEADADEPSSKDPP